MVPIADGQHIRNNRSTEKAVRPGRQAGSHRSVALDGRQGDVSSDGCSHRRVSPHRPTPIPGGTRPSVDGWALP